MKEESLLRIRIRVRVRVAVGRRYRIAGKPVPSVCPLGQVLIPAPLAAERPPALIDGTRPTLDARQGLAHPIHSIGFQLVAGSRWL